MSGDPVEMTPADVAACAAAYDPEKHEAPIVVGHPTHDAPAYGWVSALLAEGGDLNAQPTQVDPAFAEMVREGRFKKRSAAFYRPDSPANPVPGVYYLHHVGFLGAMPPAVKGLRPVALAESADLVTLGEWDDATSASLWRNLREWIIGKFGVDEADKVVPGYDVGSLEQSAQEEIQKDAAEGAMSSQFSEQQETPVPPTPEQLATLQAEADELRGKLRDIEAREAARALEARTADATAFAESLIGPGADGKARLAAKHRDTVVDLLMLASAPTADGGLIEFGEGESKRSAVTALKALLSDLPPVLNFSQQATADRAAGTQLAASDAEIAARARTYQATLKEQGQMISLAEAVDAVNADKDRS
jgi:hypothetical protein